MSTATLDREQVEARRDELEPLVAEFKRLERILGVWDESRGNGKTASDTKPRRTSATAGTRAKRGSRSSEFVELVKAEPGLTVAQYAKKMSGGINDNYLYRLAGKLADEGEVVKKDKGYFPAE